MSAEYLITGLPRMRSAWLSQVLTTDSLPCIHARKDIPIPLPVSYGLSDPTDVCINPEAALFEFAGKPVVVVLRNPVEAFESSKRRFKDAVTPASWDFMVNNLSIFTQKRGKHKTLYVNYEDLNKPDTVQALALHVGVLTRISSILRLQMLNIQQNDKCLPYINFL